MQLISHMIDYRLRPLKTFNNHFVMDHRFHGVEFHHISESYLIYPKSNLALHLFYDGLYFPSIDLNLKCKISKFNDKLTIELQVNDPKESVAIIKEIKLAIIKQLAYMEKRLSTDPTINYIQKFCKECAHEKKLPLNLCINSCKFELKQKKLKH